MQSSYYLNNHAIIENYHTVLIKFTILCWAAFITVLSHIWPQTKFGHAWEFLKYK